ncbi:uncharacterized protein [Ptychodera flava]|uniref:uncharacterized protein n=1 Tax=Ptychodera flava TaxID=63121 RepID=UPI00396A2E2C
MADQHIQKRASQDNRGVLSKPPSGRPVIQVKTTAVHTLPRELNVKSSKHLLFEPSDSDLHQVKYPLQKRPLSAKASFSTTPNIQTLNLEDNDYVKYQRQQAQAKRDSSCAKSPDPGKGSKTVKIESESSSSLGGTKHLLFEPVEIKRQSPSPSAQVSSSTEKFKRRPQSAKARLESSRQLSQSIAQSKKTTRFSANKQCYGNVEDTSKRISVRQRPQSAKFAKEKDSAQGHRQRPMSAKPRLDCHAEREALKGKTLEIDLKGSGTEKDNVHDTNTTHSAIDVTFPYKLSDTVDEPKPKKEEKEKEYYHGIPRGIAALAPFLTQDIPQEWCGIDPKCCLVFLPSLLYQDEDLPQVPPPQQPDDVIPHKLVPPTPPPFDPKKLFHYTGDKSRSESVMCDHTIYSSEGKVLHDPSKYAVRTRDVIQREIEDLENLLQGIGRAESDNIVVQYQHDINILQREVRKTLRKARHIRTSSPEEEPMDVFGLRQFYREHDETIQRIKRQRDACMQELSELEAQLGMQIQREVMKEYS